MKRQATRGAVLWAAVLSTVLPNARAGDEAVDFNRDIRPILSNTCFACHGPDENERKADLRLDTAEGILSDRGGYAVVVPGAPDESELIYRVTSEDELDVMPPPSMGKALTDHEIDLLTRWVEQGASVDTHWAYVAPDPTVPPEVTDPSWPRNPIDRFILARLEQEGLDPSPEADRRALIRRVSLDLTGLPPTLDAVEAFAADPDPDAYEQLVDRLLASPAYGEHWARLWLDLARYADSAGYADDPERTIWAYRDYVIRSFNANKPFDQFTVEQLAGDLLPDPTEGQLTATAFHRNTMTNSEGGTNDEEFRNVAVVDRVNTTMTVWMGSSMACAQCHTHKYDPITQRDYFRFFAILNNTEDADRRDEAPVLDLYSDQQEQQKEAWRREIAALEAVLGSRDPELRQARERWERAFRIELPARILSPLTAGAQTDAIAEYSQAIDPELLPSLVRISELRKQLSEMKPETTVPILRELPDDQRRTTHIQKRGNYLDLGDEVTPGVPESLFSLETESPPDRLDLARWLVDEDNPLTARVIANRSWEQVFGAGLVLTSEEFGSQGEPPTHPALLDWLATELVRQGWDMKAFLKLLVTSATYRQSARVTPERLERDPDNQFLSRGPRFRLSAEMVRDQALFVSGLLSPRMFGPPVNPPRPETGLTAAFGSAIDQPTSEGQDRYRRALYTEWRRTNPYPSMTTFDAPNRDVCTVRRDRTNTPLQALVTLNDPVYVEASQALARRIVEDGGSTTEDRARHGVLLCLAREPSEEELDRLVLLFEEARSVYADDPEQARQMATDPLGPAPEGMDEADLAAWTVVGNVLLNLDEMFSKR